MPPKLRRFVHIVLAETLHYSGALTLRRWFRRKVFHRDEICVLGLHRVLTKSEQERSNSLGGIIVRNDTYLQLLEYVQRQFQIVSLDTFLASMEKGAVFSKPLCLVTFDDGWTDTYSHAFQGLRKFGLPAVVFLATGSIGSPGGFWVESVQKAWRDTGMRKQIGAIFCDLTLANAAPADPEPIVEWLKRMPTEKRNAILRTMLPASESPSGQEEIDRMLTWDQAREMSDSGVEMGAHTVSHPLLSYEDKAYIERELQLSKQTLEEKLGKSVRAFAYPNGDWNEMVRKQVTDTGYRCAFTTRAAWYDRSENPYTVSRILLHEGNITAEPGEFSPAMFELTLAGWA
jgi:peptidoglycan/xylan/chitin deacetylase (PgdA/CDA1 family)